jgi:hypothetical protein
VATEDIRLEVWMKAIVTVRTAGWPPKVGASLKRKRPLRSCADDYGVRLRSRARSVSVSMYDLRWEASGPAAGPSDPDPGPIDGDSGK